MPARSGSPFHHRVQPWSRRKQSPHSRHPYPGRQPLERNTIRFHTRKKNKRRNPISVLGSVRLPTNYRKGTKKPRKQGKGLHFSSWHTPVSRELQYSNYGLKSKMNQAFYKWDKPECAFLHRYFKPQTPVII